MSLSLRAPVLSAKEAKACDRNYATALARRDGQVAEFKRCMDPRMAEELGKMKDTARLVCAFHGNKILTRAFQSGCTGCKAVWCELCAAEPAGHMAVLQSSVTVGRWPRGEADPVLCFKCEEPLGVESADEVQPVEVPSLTALASAFVQGVDKMHEYACEAEQDPVGAAANPDGTPVVDVDPDGPPVRPKGRKDKGGRVDVYDLYAEVWRDPAWENATRQERIEEAERRYAAKQAAYAAKKADNALRKRAHEDNAILREERVEHVAKIARLERLFGAALERGSGWWDPAAMRVELEAADDEAQEERWVSMEDLQAEAEVEEE